jgi:lipopolysaccharide biosynthesis protein
VTRLVAFYLPQFHPIPENDEWWGRGFTEWTNVTQGRPTFPGHHQPHLPADLGFYDLRLPEARAAQAELAAAFGVHGFCWYHYWFHGTRLLQRPFEEVLASGEPDFPFCLCWANEAWTRAWDGRSGDVLMAQRHSEEDDLAHLRWLAGAFADPRHIRVDGKPLFLVYRARRLPDARRTVETWRQEASRLGIGELYLCRVESYSDEHGDPADLGFDAAVEFQPDWRNLGAPRRQGGAWRAARALRLSSRGYAERVYDYDTVVDRMLARPPVEYRRFPCVMPSWDNTPRAKRERVVMHGASPDGYERWLRAVLSREEGEDPLVFVNAWNEWAEGNHLEPDQRFGRGYLEATRRALTAT